jgi:hypothetical protein
MEWTAENTVKWRTRAPFGWAALGSTIFAWDNAKHTKWHAVYDIIDDRAHSSRNLSQEQADALHIVELLNKDLENG